MIQGPLAGISCAPFRYLTWRYSQPAFCCTEMISCKTILQQPKHSNQRYLKLDPNEGPTCFQFAASDPIELAETTKIVTDYGAAIIDLNCGCPVKKIRSKSAGSKLLSDAGKLYQLIRAMKDNTHAPVSIKIRVQSNKENFNREICKVAADSGLDFLVVHGRHWTEHYETPCNYSEIKYFVDELKIPVIGNGDISDEDSLKKMLATGCAGIMISRAGVGQPWLIGKLIAALKQEFFPIPNLEEIGSVFLEHVQRLANLLDNPKFAIFQARKFAKYYARNMPKKAEFCQVINDCEDLTLLAVICKKYFV